MSGPADIIVLGGTGQIGTCLMRRLQDHAVIATSRHPQADTAGRREWLTLDLTGNVGDFGVLPTQAIATLPLWLLPDHLAGLSRGGVRRLVCFSSTSIMGKEGTTSAYERAQMTALVTAEEALQRQAADLGIGLSILRPTLIYGLGLDANVTAAARFIRRFGFYPIQAPAMGLRQPVHADDLAAAALLVAARDDLAGQHFALGGGETLPYRDMIGRIFAALGMPPRILPVPGLAMLAALYGRVSGNAVLTAETVNRMNRDLVFDHGEAAQAFGFAPRGFLSAGRADLGF